MNTKKEKLEDFNFKKKENQETFKQLTSETSEFTDCFKTNAPLYCQIENWRKILRSYCSQVFQKIKLKKRKRIKVNSKIAQLISRKNEINSRKCKNCNFKQTINQESRPHKKNY